MKKILVTLMFLLTIFSCGNTPETTVSNFLGDIKEKNIKSAKEYVMNKEVIDNFNFKPNNKTQAVFFEALFKNLKYEIKDKITREDGTEVINVNIENLDVEKIFIKAYKNIFKKTFSGAENIKIEEEFNKILFEEKLPKKNIISQFLIEKKDGKYFILLRKENIDDIFGSYFSSLYNIQN